MNDQPEIKLYDFFDIKGALLPPGADFYLWTSPGWSYYFRLVDSIEEEDPNEMALSNYGKWEAVTQTAFALIMRGLWQDEHRRLSWWANGWGRRLQKLLDNGNAKSDLAQIVIGRYLKASPPHTDSENQIQIWTEIIEAAQAVKGKDDA